MLIPGRPGRAPSKKRQVLAPKAAPQFFWGSASAAPNAEVSGDLLLFLLLVRAEDPDGLFNFDLDLHLFLGLGVFWRSAFQRGVFCHVPVASASGVSSSLSVSGACQWSERGSTTTTFSAVSPRAGGNHLGGHPDFLVVLKGDHQLDGVVQENRHGLRCETRSEVPLDLWAPNRVQQKVWWRSGLHVVSTPGTGRTCRRLPSFQPVLYAISSESLSPQKFDYSSIAGSGDHSATLSLSAVKLICWQKNQLQPQSDLLHGRPWAATLPRLSHRTSFDTLWNMLDCKSYWVGSGSRSTSSAEQLFVKLSLSCRCGILRPLEVISFAFAIACSLKSENWKGKAMCCQEATISSDNLPAPFPQLIGSAGGSPLATSAGSHAGTLDPSDPGSQIQAWIHIPVVDGVDDTPAGMAFVWLWALPQQLRWYACLSPLQA